MKDLPQITLQEIVKSYICHVHDVLMDDPIPGETDTKFFSSISLQYAFRMTPLLIPTKLKQSFLGITSQVSLQTMREHILRVQGDNGTAGAVVEGLPAVQALMRPQGAAVLFTTAATRAATTTLITAGLG